MEEATAGGLTLIDWAVIAVVGLSALLALFRGFVREVLSLAAWLIAAFVSITYYDDARDLLAQHIDSKMVVMGLSTIGLYILVLVSISIINAFIMRFLHAGGDISILDSLLGMVFGMARGLFIFALAYIMFTVVLPKEDFPEIVKNSKTLPVIEKSADILTAIAPNRVKDLQHAAKTAKEEGEKSAREEAEKQLRHMQETGEVPEGYDEGQRKQLERLLKVLEREGVDPSQLRSAPGER